jgi:hypothetical protein
MKKFILPIIYICFCFYGYANEGYSFINDSSEEKKIREDSCPVKDTNKCCGEVEKNSCDKRLRDSSCCFKEGVFFSLDFLYWRANTSAAYFAEEKISTGGAYENNYHYIRTDSKWDPGFRARLGYNFDYDNWDILGCWSYYHTKHKRTKRGENYNLLGGLGVNSFADINLAKGSWNLNYSMFDLEMGKTYYIKEKLAFRPNIGARGGWLNQFFWRYYDEPAEPDPNLPATNVVKSYYWGIGPKVGLDSNWHLTRYFSIFGNADLILLFGKQEMRREAQFFVSEELGWYRLKDFDNLYVMKPAIQLAMGISCGSCFNCDKWFFGVDLGVEYSYYWDQYSVMNSISLYELDSPVDLVGFTLAARFEF